MKIKIFLAVFSLILLAGCYAKYDVITDQAGTPEPPTGVWLWNSYYNFNENSTQKCVNKETGESEPVGSYSVGKKSASYYKIVYKQNYLQNLISVCSLGIFVPMQVDLYLNESRPVQNTEEAAK